MASKGEMLSMQIKGLDDLTRMIERGERAVIAAAAGAVTEVAFEVGRKADDLVPVDTGALRGSQTIKLPRKDPRGIRAEVAYGGPAAPYAVVQHEDLTLWHPPKPPSKSKVGKRQGTGPVAPGQGRGPKYLETPLKQAHKDFGKLIVNRVKELLR